MRYTLVKVHSGWKFLFQKQKEYNNFEEFKKWITTQDEYIIKDEYGNEVSIEDLLKLIEKKQETNNPDDFTYNENIDGYSFSENDFS